jgi:conjugal transfer pilus assembly protein TraL
VNNRKLLIPRRLDDPPRFFFWDFDVALVFAGIAMFGILANMFFTSLLIAFGVAALFKKVKSGQQRGYGVHVLYWHLPFSIGFRRTPPSFVREWIG